MRRRSISNVPSRGATSFCRPMRDTNVIDGPTYEIALRSQPHLADALRSEENFGQYFKEEVRKQLVQRFGWERVYQGGLKVYTTIDLEIQKTAEAQVAQSIAEIEKRQLKRVTQAQTIRSASGGARGP
jgi:membrane carboxypeptidase/penicillin-binding protein